MLRILDHPYAAGALNNKEKEQMLFDERLKAAQDQKKEAEKALQEMAVMAAEQAAKQKMDELAAAKQKLQAAEEAAEKERAAKEAAEKERVAEEEKEAKNQLAVAKEAQVVAALAETGEPKPLHIPGEFPHRTSFGA